ncbi:unnamed protein product [Fraxinus pennsylvanica]|uniref:Mitochondrial transcription termination factor family protein n=1 Tax=Fraxinus pennsylvanica TaxID=56036 RepID=A0AAD2E8B8_9LAMI|nr:unnamed protein product [Fraxinus pennsylvanica]
MFSLLFRTACRGVLSSDLPKVIMGNPALLAGSIEKQFIPCYNFLKTLVDSDEDIVRILKRSPRILSCNLKVMEPNVELLGEAGIPESSISYMLIHYPHSVQMKCEKFKRSVDKAIQMGFHPSRMLFIRAVHVLCEISEQGWENRIKVYRSFGLSDSEIVSAFRSHPLCMKLSEEKITRGMEFYVNEMSWSPAKVARCPVALFYNLERRIIPRCRVIKILMEKGFVKEHSTLISFLSISDPQFLTKFVLNYKNDLPEIMDVITLDRSGRIIIAFDSISHDFCRKAYLNWSGVAVMEAELIGSSPHSIGGKADSIMVKWVDLMPEVGLYCHVTICRHEHQLLGCHAGLANVYGCNESLFTISMASGLKQKKRSHTESTPNWGSFLTGGGGAVEWGGSGREPRFGASVRRLRK